MLYKKINELESISTPSSIALLPIQDGDTTYKFGLNNICKTSPGAGSSIHNIDMNPNAPYQLFYITSKAKDTATSAGHIETLTISDNGLDVWDSTSSDQKWGLVWNQTSGNLQHRLKSHEDTYRVLLDNVNSTAYKSGGIKTSNTGGYSTDQYGNPVHTSASTQNAWCIINNAGTATFQANYQTGKIVNSYLCPTATGKINCNNNFTGFLLWVKIGRIVFFQIADLACVTATSTNGYVLFSGLPAPASTQAGGPFTVQRYATENASGTHLRLSIGTNSSNQGIVFIHYDSAEANSAQYYGSHWYLAAQ